MRLRSVVVVEHPTVEPVSLGEAKAHLGLMPDQTDDDAMIQGMVAAARRLIERRLGVALAKQQLRAKYDSTEGWARLNGRHGPAVLRLPMGPAMAGVGVNPQLDIDDVEVAAVDYVLDTDDATIRFSSPPSLDDTQTLSVRYWAGPTGPIAPQLRAALLLYVGHLYANREAVSTQGHSEVPMAFETLLASESVSGRW